MVLMTSVVMIAATAWADAPLMSAGLYKAGPSDTAIDS
jgi:hypothetical protein